MGILASELSHHVIAPTLKSVGLYSSGAEMLLLGTAAQESHLGYYLKQQKGPALGIWQIEPATHKDIWVNFLDFRPELSKKVEKFSMFKDYEAISLREIELVTNLAYACIMARLVYYRISEPLPPPHDAHAMARYWKKYYNTPLGKGTVEEFVENYNRL